MSSTWLRNLVSALQITKCNIQSPVKKKKKCHFKFRKQVYFFTDNLLRNSHGVYELFRQKFITFCAYFSWGCTAPEQIVNICKKGFAKEEECNLIEVALLCFPSVSDEGKSIFRAENTEKQSSALPLFAGKRCLSLPWSPGLDLPTCSFPAYSAAAQHRIRLGFCTELDCTQSWWARRTNMTRNLVDTQVFALLFRWWSGKMKRQ